MKQTKTESDLQARVIELESQLAQQKAELAILAPRHGGDHARDQRRRAEHAKDQAQLAIRNATMEERVKMFPAAYQTGGGRSFVQTLSSFCQADGGVVGFARACRDSDPATFEMLLASVRHPDQFLEELALPEELEPWVRYYEPTKPNLGSCMEGPIEVTEAQGEQLRASGVPTERLGKDSAVHYLGFRMWNREAYDEPKAAHDARWACDPEYRALLKSGALKIRALDESEVRVKLQLARGNV